MNNHEMKLAGEYFDRVKSGDKTLELRLFDEKRKLIQLGDTITFKKFPKLQEQVSVVVTGLLRYPKFENLIEETPASWLGYTEQDKPYLKTSMYEIYTPEEEKECGVLGIRIKRIAQNDTV